jgi:ABC-type branched-subunit amino acid transport system substrate-binding protein
MKSSTAVRLFAATAALAVFASGCSKSTGDTGAATATPSGSSSAASSDSTSAAPSGSESASQSGPTSGSESAQPSSSAPAATAFHVDAGKCPSAATQPVAAGATLKIGTVWPLTGPYAALGQPIVGGMKTAFARINADGGVADHKLELIAGDDGYDPSKTVPVITQMLQQDKVFATLGQAGTPNVAAVQPLMEQACTPQLWVGTGADQYGDPANHPWTTIGVMSYATEAQAWSQNIKAAQPGAKVAYLALNNDTGSAYANAFNAAAKADGLDIVASQQAAAGAPSVANQVTSILAAQPDYVVLMSIGADCAKAIGTLAQGGYHGKIIVAYTCAGQTIFPVLGAAASGAGTVVEDKDVTDTSDPQIQQFRADVQAYGAGLTPDEDVLLGYRLAMLMKDTISEAAALTGGLTQANLMDAAWNLDTHWFAALGGVARMDGTSDSYPLEYGQMATWDAAKKALVLAGAPIDREGKTGTFTD